MTRGTALTIQRHFIALCDATFELGRAQKSCVKAATSAAWNRGSGPEIPLDDTLLQNVLRIFHDILPATQKELAAAE